MEEKKIIKPISEKVFREKAAILAEENHSRRMSAFIEKGILSLRIFDGVHRYKSIRRAIRRGLVSLYGDIYPKRPFSNKKRKKGTATYDRRIIYAQYRK